MIFPEETKTKQAIKDAIESRQRRIASIKEALPYADHGAYGQDKQRIRDYEEEITQLKRSLAIANGEVV